MILAEMEAYGMLEMLDIKDEADAMAHLAVSLAAAFEDPDVDRYLDMPYQRAMLLIKELDRRGKEMKRHASPR